MSIFAELNQILGQQLPDDAVPGEGIDVPIPSMDDLEIEDTEDGGVNVRMSDDDGSSQPIPDDLPFNANLAEYLSEDELGELGSSIIDKVKQDYESNQEWRDSFNNGLKYLGFKPENRDFVFKGASGAWDTKLTESLVRFHAEIYAELFPADGPMKTKIIGLDNEELRQQADRVANWSNYYLTRIAKEYYDDSDVMLNYVLLAGSAFRKAYICPILQRPVLKYITPNQVAIPYSATGIHDAPRFTHICDDLQERDLRIMQINKYYRDVEISRIKLDDISNDDTDETMGIDDSRTDDDEPYTVCETMIDLDLPGFEHTDENGEETGLPLPYKVSVSADGTILRIEKNWDEKNALNTGLYVKNLNIAHYKFMPGFGALGIGLIHCLLSSVDTRTKIKRMLQDSGVFANFPPTVRVKGMRMENNTAGLAPGTNMEIDTGGMPIGNAIQQMTVKEPSQMLYQLGKDEGDGADRLIGNMDIAVGDGRQDAPVGTTMALLQQAKKPQTGVMRRLHRALTQELEMLYKMFGEWLPEEPYPYPVSGVDGTIMRSDFNGRVNPIPVSDPNMMNQTERMLRTETIMRIASQLPPNAPANVIEAARRMFMQMGIDDIEKLLPPLPQAAQPQDPVTENMQAMMNTPIKAFIEQNHQAHIAVHTPIAQNSPAMQAHISEHQAMLYKLTVENQMGTPLPPEGTPLPPQVQEQIAMMAAKATQEYMDKLEAQKPKAPPTVEEIMLMDVQQKREKEQLRHQTELDKFTQEDEMAKLKYDNAAAERSVKLDIAHLKTAASVSVEQNKLDVLKTQ